MVDSITKLHFHCLHVLTHTNDIDSTALTVRAARPKPNVLLRPSLRCKLQHEFN